MPSFTLRRLQSTYGFGAIWYSPLSFSLRDRIVFLQSTATTSSLSLSLSLESSGERKRKKGETFKHPLYLILWLQLCSIKFIGNFPPSSTSSVVHTFFWSSCCVSRRKYSISHPRVHTSYTRMAFGQKCIYSTLAVVGVVIFALCLTMFFVFPQLVSKKVQKVIMMPIPQF